MTTSWRLRLLNMLVRKEQGSSCQVHWKAWASCQGQYCIKLSWETEMYKRSQSVYPLTSPSNVMKTMLIDMINNSLASIKENLLLLSACQTIINWRFWLKGCWLFAWALLNWWHCQSQHSNCCSTAANTVMLKNFLGWSSIHTS